MADFSARSVLAYQPGKEEQLAYASSIPALSHALCFAAACQYKLHLETGALSDQLPLLMSPNFMFS